ncbi:hypothetical protein [Edaphovirga cremea]|uniref:hypothetical protein n=1 Tax=Edaphovirga cremea TaxID=2267246 RepID=UPI003989C4AF
MKFTAALLVVALTSPTAHANIIAAKLIKSDSYESILVRLSDNKFDKRCDGSYKSRLDVVSVVTGPMSPPIKADKACYMSADDDNLTLLFWTRFLAMEVFSP